jgi:hypothetical protein
MPVAQNSTEGQSTKAMSPAPPGVCGNTRHMVRASCQQPTKLNKPRYIPVSQFAPSEARFRKASTLMKNRVLDMP